MGTPCRATRVAADFLRILRFFRCSRGVALHPPPPPKKLCRTCRPSTARGVARQAASEKIGGCSSYTCVCALHCATTSPAQMSLLAFPWKDGQGWRKNIEKKCSSAGTGTKNLISQRTWAIAIGRGFVKVVFPPFSGWNPKLTRSGLKAVSKRGF